MALPQILPTVHTELGECRLCRRALIVRSIESQARQVYLQIEHTARRSLGFGPNAAELAKRMGWPLERVEAAMQTLFEQELLAPFKDKPGEYRAKIYGHREALHEAERLRRLAEAERDQERGRRGEVARQSATLEAKNRQIAELEQRVRDQNQVVRHLNDAKDALVKELGAAQARLATRAGQQAAAPVPAPALAGGPQEDDPAQEAGG